MLNPFLHFAQPSNNVFASRFCLVLLRDTGQTFARLTKGDAPVLGTTEASMSKTTGTTQRYQHARF